MSTAPPAIVQGAPRTPFPFGLFSLVSDRGAEAEDGRWQNGTQWMPLACAPATGVGEVCPSGVVITRSGGDDQLIDSSTPFTVYYEYKASPIGRSIEEAEQRATAGLIAREEARVEQAIWSGDLSNTPSFQGATDYTSGGAVASAAALALLEDHIASVYGSLGVIHVTRGGLVVLGQNGLIGKEGNRLVTAAGTPVVAGAGYPGTDPSGADPASGEAWAYATPAMFLYRSDIIYSSNRPGDLLDRTVNDLYAVAMRTYDIGWDDCGVGAARFTLGCC